VGGALLHATPHTPKALSRRPADGGRRRDQHQRRLSDANNLAADDVGELLPVGICMETRASKVAGNLGIMLA
jgi:hypothetical protein